MITVKKMAVKAIYLELGFEDLSHFSYAFKKAYGVAPFNDSIGFVLYQNAVQSSNKIAIMHHIGTLIR